MARKMAVFISLSLLATIATASPCTTEHTRVVLVKTHKTGGSTLANIVYRYGESHNLSFLLPRDDLRLGWPEDFPGRYNNYGRTSYDVVAFHAVLNHQVMLSFVPKAKFITIVREPRSQFISAWYFFGFDRKMKQQQARVRHLPPSPHAPPSSRTNVSQVEAITLEAINDMFPPPPHRPSSPSPSSSHSSLLIDPASLEFGAGRSEARIRAVWMHRLLNSQSFTLGWADYKSAVIKQQRNVAALAARRESVTFKHNGIVNNKMKNGTNVTTATMRRNHGRRRRLTASKPSAEEMLAGDVDDALIGRFLGHLDGVMDVVLVIDRLDESLVVLGQSLCWRKFSGSLMATESVSLANLLHPFCVVLHFYFSLSPCVPASVQ